MIIFKVFINTIFLEKKKKQRFWIATLTVYNKYTFGLKLKDQEIEDQGQTFFRKS